MWSLITAVIASLTGLYHLTVGQPTVGVVLWILAVLNLVMCISFQEHSV